MPRRRRRLTVAPPVAALAIGAAALGGCQNDSPASSCQLAQQVTLAGSPLTLLQNARLDHIRDGYLLVGADDANLRWATLDGTTGQMGAEHSAAIDTPRAGLWYGAAGGLAPGDTLLAAVGLKAANGVDQEIHVVPLPADGSAGPGARPVLATIPGGAASGAHPLVAAASSRLGMAAGLAWADSSRGAVMLAVLGPSGDPVAPPAMVDATAPAFSCLSFQPGRDELTLGYFKYTDPADPMPTYVIAEIHENGNIDSIVTLILSTRDALCPLIVPTSDGGYALAWQDSLGTWLSVYHPDATTFGMEPVAGSASFGGPDLQPPLAGFAPVGTDYAVVFAEVRSAELWRVDAGGERRAGALVLPSALGNMGTISSVPVAGSLSATYADYTSTGAGVGAAGSRYFLRVSCF
jgi:hypothetical protein